LTQVTRYLTDETVREQARTAVLDLVDAETRVIIGHSLGSVVAYECAHRLTHQLPLLLTTGSPLGLPTIVTERLNPPPSFPLMATVWLNVANREDFVAAEPDLRSLFAHNAPPASRFDGARFDEVCKDPHRAETYLGREAVGRAVIEALE
jgi:alpha-beta hydrolase superfamily lysophospholipase